MEKTLVLSQSYVEVSDEEVEYLDGSLSTIAKIAIVAGCVAAVAAIGVAIAYGCVALVASLAKMALATFVKKFGAAVIAGFLSAALGGAGGGYAFGLQICQWIEGN